LVGDPCRHRRRHPAATTIVRSSGSPLRRLCQHDRAAGLWLVISPCGPARVTNVVSSAAALCPLRRHGMVSVGRICLDIRLAVLTTLLPFSHLAATSPSSPNLRAGPLGDSSGPRTPLPAAEIEQHIEPWWPSAGSWLANVAMLILRSTSGSHKDLRRHRADCTAPSPT